MTPEFQHLGREVAAAVKAAGKPIETIAAQKYIHELVESLANSYELAGATLKMMGIAG